MLARTRFLVKNSSVGASTHPTNAFRNRNYVITGREFKIYNRQPAFEQFRTILGA
jgi:hypothetical protein